MAVITRYELRVEGMLNGLPADNAAEIAEFKKALRENPPTPQGGPGSTAPWPEGVIIKGYTPHIWKVDCYKFAHDDLTMLVFHAEFSICFAGSSHEPATKSRAVQEYEWFLSHDQLKWCETLMAETHTLNHSFHMKGKLHSPVMMKRFHWYIGNGGC